MKMHIYNYNIKAIKTKSVMGTEKGFISGEGFLISKGQLPLIRILIII